MGEGELESEEGEETGVEAEVGEGAKLEGETGVGVDEVVEEAEEVVDEADGECICTARGDRERVVASNKEHKVGEEGGETVVKASFS